MKSSTRLVLGFVFMLGSHGCAGQLDGDGDDSEVADELASCGEATCIPVTTKGTSYYTGTSCTGTEMHYGPATWDGQGLAGTQTSFIQTLSQRGVDGVCRAISDQKTLGRVYRGTAPSAAASTMQISAVSPARCLNVAGSSMISGSRVSLYDCLSTARSERFILTSSGGYSTFKFDHSGLCLTSSGTANGSATTQATCNGSAAQQFTLKAATTAGAYQLVNRASGRCLDVPANGANNAAVAQYDCWSGTNQQFKLSATPSPIATTTGGDADQDGYADAVDCDDANPRVYPGISVACSAACGSGTRTCGSSGAFTACSCTPLCEATAGGKCYYISSATGADTNPGTFAQPWKTYLNISYSYTPPATAHALVPGDVVYFMAGTYRTTAECCGAGSDPAALYLRNVSGTAAAPIVIKNYPGALAILSPVGAPPIHLLSVNYIRIEGLEVKGGFGNGVLVGGSTGLELRNLRVHDVDGIGANNSSGLYFSSVVEGNVHHNDVYDNYDRTFEPERDDHKQNVILFRGGNFRFHHNHVFQTKATVNVHNAGILYKHKSDVANAKFEVDHNRFDNLQTFSIGSGSPNTHIHHNLIVDSAGMRFADFGGPTQNANIVVDHNTHRGFASLVYTPTTTVGTGYGPVGPFSFRYNIVVDESPPYAYDNFLLNIGHYKSDAQYQTVVSGGLLALSSNCYFHGSGPLSLSLYGAGGAYGLLGAVHTFASWQQAGFDAGTSIANPLLDGNEAPALSACKAYGHLAP